MLIHIMLLWSHHLFTTDNVIALCAHIMSLTYSVQLTSSYKFHTLLFSEWHLSCFRLIHLIYLSSEKRKHLHFVKKSKRHRLETACIVSTRWRRTQRRGGGHQREQPQHRTKYRGDVGCHDEQPECEWQPYWPHRGDPRREWPGVGQSQSDRWGQSLRQSLRQHGGGP